MTARATLDALLVLLEPMAHDKLPRGDWLLDATAFHGDRDGLRFEYRYRTQVMRADPLAVFKEYYPTRSPVRVEASVHVMHPNEAAREAWIDDASEVELTRLGFDTLLRMRLER